MLRHFRRKNCGKCENKEFFTECEKSDCYKSSPTRPPVKKIFKIKLLGLFLLYVLLCGASSSCIRDLYLLQLRVQLFYDAKIRQNGRVLSVSLRGNFEKIRIMTTFGSRVTQRGRQFEVRALYFKSILRTNRVIEKQRNRAKVDKL